MLLSDITESMINDYYSVNGHEYFHFNVFKYFFGPLCKSHQLFGILQ